MRRRLIAERYFPHASSQVLLLSTDEEIDEQLLKVIQPAVGRMTYRVIVDAWPEDRVATQPPTVENSNDCGLWPRRRP